MSCLPLCVPSVVPVILSLSFPVSAPLCDISPSLPYLYIYLSILYIYIGPIHAMIHKMLNLGGKVMMTRHWTRIYSVPLIFLIRGLPSVAWSHQKELSEARLYIQMKLREFTCEKLWRHQHHMMHLFHHVLEASPTWAWETKSNSNGLPTFPPWEDIAGHFTYDCAKNSVTPQMDRWMMDGCWPTSDLNLGSSNGGYSMIVW